MPNEPEINAERTEELQPERPLAWGIAPPDGTVAAWGARAIYTENRAHGAERYTKRGKLKKNPPKTFAFAIELLWDRQAGAGRNAELRLLQDWINATGLPWLRKECSERYITTDCDERITFTEGDYTITASPRESCGYLYIGAWYSPSKES